MSKKVTIRCLDMKLLEELVKKPSIRLIGVVGWDLKQGTQNEHIHVIDTKADPKPGDKVFVRRTATGDEYYKEFGEDTFDGVETIGVLYGVYTGPQKPLQKMLESRHISTNDGNGHNGD